MLANIVDEKVHDLVHHSPNRSSDDITALLRMIIFTLRRLLLLLVTLFFLTFVGFSLSYFTPHAPLHDISGPVDIAQPTPADFADPGLSAAAEYQPGS